MNVLIVEDEVLIAMNFQNMLEHEGHRVSGIAMTPAQAIELAEQTHPDVAICDVRLAHGTSGIEAAQRLQRRFSVPSLMVTSACTEARQAHDGAIGCLPKPVEPSELVQSIEAVAQISSGRWPRVIPRRLELYVAPPRRH